MPTNERLATLMIEAGFLDQAGTIGRKRFARAVTDAAAARSVGRSYTHTYVSRWLAGVTPRDEETRRAIGDALGVRLGRRLAPDELGFSAVPTVSPDLGLSFPAHPEQGVQTVAEILQADLAETEAVLGSPYNVSAWNESAIAWLVGGRQAASVTRAPGRVGASDVARLRSMRDTFDRVDNSFGGAHARQALVRYLSQELPRLLRAGASDDVRTALYSAAGESTHLAAWMAYDSGLHGLAQRYFIQALGFADAAGDRLLGASVLDAMSHQASFLGRHREAANMARAAALGTQNAGTPLLLAHFHIMEARALARAGDVIECDRAMGNAVLEFERQRTEDNPAWLAYFDAAELSAEMAHCHRDLGRPDLAIECGTRALSSASGDYARSDFFVALVLADAHLDRGDVGAGCRVAAKALDVGQELDSARCRSYVDEFKARLRRHADVAEVREFEESIDGNHLWGGVA